jgi:hypothetical protein
MKYFIVALIAGAALLAYFNWYSKKSERKKEDNPKPKAPDDKDVSYPSATNSIGTTGAVNPVAATVPKTLNTGGVISVKFNQPTNSPTIKPAQLNLTAGTVSKTLKIN